MRKNQRSEPRTPQVLASPSLKINNLGQGPLSTRRVLHRQVGDHARDAERERTSFLGCALTDHTVADLIAHD